MTLQNMKQLPILFAFLMCTLSVAAQEERRVTVSDLSGMVYRGLEAIERLAPYRYTTTSKSESIRLEVDSKRIRSTSFNSYTGAIDSECIMIGDQIYQRWGTGPWIVRTRHEYTAAQANRSAEMKDALSKNDTDTYKRLSAAPHNKATSAAIFRLGTEVMTEPTNSNMSDKAITFLGRENYKDKVFSVYRFRGNVYRDKFSPSTELRLLRIEILYWFEKGTGALRKERTKLDWVYDSKTTTHVNFYEWEPDSSIVISQPVVATSKH